MDAKLIVKNVDKNPDKETLQRRYFRALSRKDVRVSSLLSANLKSQRPVQDFPLASQDI
jgi:hypothetical protein